VFVARQQRAVGPVDQQPGEVMGELAAVTRVDGRVIGDGRPGPMTGRLTELFRALTAREGSVVLERA